MLAIIKYPKEKVAGNLLWHPPYLYPMDHLEEGMESLREKGFWISAFPEGDGLTFTHDSFTGKKLLDELKMAFPWMKIKEEIEGINLAEDEDAQKTQLVILPIARLRIEEPILTENYCIFPPGEFTLPHSTIRKLDDSEFEDAKPSKNLRDHIIEFTKVNIEVFETFPVVVFYTKKAEYSSFRKLRQTDDEFLIKELSAEAEPIMDIIKFFNADYSVPEFLPSTPGIWNGRYSAVLIYFVPYKIAHILSREVEYKDYIKGIGMDITDSQIINKNPLTAGVTGETGNVLKHAFRLHAAIMQTDDETLKFTQIITLFEYLAEPFEYMKGKDAKAKIAVHIAKNKTEFHNFCNRYKELTGVSQVDGKKNPGLRTSIVHWGKRIEDLLPLKIERDKLFLELYRYVYSVLLDMLIHSSLQWQEFSEYRESIRIKLKV